MPPARSAVVILEAPTRPSPPPPTIDIEPIRALMTKLKIFGSLRSDLLKLNHMGGPLNGIRLKVEIERLTAAQFRAFGESSPEHSDARALAILGLAFGGPLSASDCDWVASHLGTPVADPRLRHSTSISQLAAIHALQLTGRLDELAVAAADWLECEHPDRDHLPEVALIVAALQRPAGAVTSARLVEVLARREPSRELRAACYSLLGQSGEPLAVDHVFTAFEAGDDAALDGIAKLTGPEARTRLDAMLADETPARARPEVLRAALTGLLRLGPDVAVPALQRVFDPHGIASREHRERIVESVRELGKHLSDPLVLPALFRVQFAVTTPLDFGLIEDRSRRFLDTSMPRVDRARLMADLRTNLETTPIDSRCFDQSLCLFAWYANAEERAYVRSRRGEIVDPQTREMIDAWFAER